MAATTTQGKDKTAGLDFDTEDSVPIISRGRGLDAQTVAIRDQLLASQKDGKARSFKNVDAEGDNGRETWARKVRSAAKAAGGMKVSTIYDAEAKKLYWGPDEVIKKLQNKGS